MRRCFLRLHRIVIGDERFVKLGFRKEGGFVGEHDHETQRPIPDHISAHHEDIASLVHGLIAFDQASSIELDPVVAAAVLAFEFVYIHPFEDGNGRTGYDGFNPPASTFRFFSRHPKTKSPHAEFLYECVQRTIEQDLPKEIRFLRSFDTFRAGVENMIDMPERTLNNLFGFLQQNEGRLKARP